MKNYFLSLDYNVWAVDYSKPAFSLNYQNCVFNTRIVGSIIAFFINRLNEKFGLKPEDFLLVGHSLGAHVCGFAGRLFGTDKIGQIFGLDPVGLGFERLKLSLQRQDANLVVIIHTSSGYFKKGIHIFYYNSNFFDGQITRAQGVGRLCTIELFLVNF